MPMAIRFHQTGGAISDQTLSAEARAELIARSESLYQKADEVEPDKRYMYSSRPTIREANTARLGAWLLKHVRLVPAPELLTAFLPAPPTSLTRTF